MVSVRKSLPIPVFALLPVLAFANGAMGLGLEQWNMAYWCVYVVATVAMEAWFIGRWIELPTGRSIAAAVIANFLTGCCCAASGIFAPFMHTSALNPNPLLSATILLASFALPSGLFETIVWRLFASPREYLRATDRRLLGGSLLAHLIGIPLALVILLIPTNPYQGLERSVSYSRSSYGLGFVAKTLTAQITEDRRLPALNPSSVEQIVRSRSPMRDAWAALYVPEYRRFDVGEARRHPLRWNSALSEMPIRAGTEDWRWLALSSGESAEGPIEGLKIDMGSGRVEVLRGSDRIDTLHP